MSVLSGLVPWMTFLVKNVYIPIVCVWSVGRCMSKWKKLTMMAEVALSFVTMYFILMPVIISVFLVNLAYRLIVSIYLKVTHGSKVWLMSGRDGFVSHDKFANSCNHYSLYIMEGECDLKKIQEKFLSILSAKWTDGDLIYDRMKRRLVRKLGLYCWEDMKKEFDINDHVRLIDSRCDVEDSPVLTEDDVFYELQKLYDYPFRGDKPQWEILVVPNYLYNDSRNDNLSNDNNNNGAWETMTTQVSQGSKSNRHYAFVVRMHHCIMDGISAGNALQHFLADRKIKLTVDPLSKEHNLKWNQIIAAYLQMFILGPYSFFKMLGFNESNPFHGPQLTGPKYMGWSKQVSVEALKKIKDWSKTSVTAVLISSLGGSVRNLAQKKNVPVPDMVHAFPTIGILPFKDIRPRNQFTMCLLPLKIGLNTEAARLNAAKTSLRNLLKSPDVLTNYHLMEIIGAFPVPIVHFFVNLCHATFLLSNVPGPAESATIFGGDKIVDIGIWAPIQLAMGIGMSLFSYGGRVRATVVVDYTACQHPKDVDILVHGFEQEILKLAKQAGLSSDSIFLKP